MTLIFNLTTTFQVQIIPITQKIMICLIILLTKIGIKENQLLFKLKMQKKKRGMLPPKSVQVKLEQLNSKVLRLWKLLTLRFQEPKSIWIASIMYKDKRARLVFNQVTAMREEIHKWLEWVFSFPISSKILT